MISNKYAGVCGRATGGFLDHTCHCNVAPHQGHLEKFGGDWVVFCDECWNVKQSGADIPTERKLTADGKVIAPFDAETIPLIKTFPGAELEVNGSVRWKVSLEQQDRLRVLELAEKLRLSIDPSLKEIEQTYIDKDAEKAGLYPFQKEGVNWLSKQRKALLADEMGLGKTIQTLMSLDFDDRVILVCPSSVKYNWKKEAEKWRPDFKVEILNGMNSFRLPQYGEMVILTYRTLPDWEDKFAIPNDIFEELKDCTLICDEAHNLSNINSQRSQKASILVRSVHKTWFLTGTPLLNRPMQLHDLLQVGNMLWDTFENTDNFKALYNARPKKVGRNKWVTGWGKPSDAVPELLRKVMLRRERKDVLDELPEKTYQYILTDNSNSLIEEMDFIYSEVKDHFKAGIIPQFEEFAKVRSNLAKSRIPAMLDFVDQCEQQGVPLVVFSAHRAPILALKERKGWGTILGDVKSKAREKTANDFQEGKINGIALTIGAGGVGLNLQRAYIALFVDLDWTPALNEQAEGRLLRIGQESDCVQFVHMVSNHPLDKHTHDLISQKMRLINNSIMVE